MGNGCKRLPRDDSFMNFADARILRPFRLQRARSSLSRSPKVPISGVFWAWHCELEVRGSTEVCKPSMPLSHAESFGITAFLTTSRAAGTAELTMTAPFRIHAVLQTFPRPDAVPRSGPRPGILPLARNVFFFWLASAMGSDGQVGAPKRSF